MRVPVVALCGAALLAASPARASNEDDFFPGNRAAMTAGAVAATVDDGSAIYFNPAGLSAAPGSRIDVSASAYALRYYSVPAFLRTPGGARRDASVTELVTIPTEIAYVRRLGPDVSLGLGYFVPRAESYLLRARLDDVGADTGAGFAVDARVTASTSLLAAAIGVRASSRLTWGIGLFGSYEDRVQSTAFLSGTSRQRTVEQVSQFSDLSTFTRIGAQLRAGMQLDLGHGLALGLVARGPRLQILRTGEDSVTFTSASVPAVGAPRLAATSTQVEDNGNKVGLLEWGRYHAAVAYRSRAATVSAEIDVQPGLQSQRTEVDRRLTVNARVGALYPLSERVTVGTGIFTDRATTAGASFANFIGGTLGIELADLLHLAASERAEGLTLTTVFALRYAHGSGPINALLEDADTSVAVSRATTTQTIHEVGLHVGSALQF